MIHKTIKTIDYEQQIIKIDIFKYVLQKNYTHHCTQSIFKEKNIVCEKLNNYNKVQWYV